MIGQRADDPPVGLGLARRIDATALTGEGELEILQVSAFSEGARNSGRTDVSEQRFKLGTAERFDAVKAGQTEDAKAS